ncbi:LacI family DNA-binding transcriptional regulator [Myceligenerans indicum]|uniref:LacI family transcriptional regulator n=1 Tax=Myceligenerans indicum TaxID=2593663 RepID=A0ABS1LQE7_9MICO|nr:LacI family DNA-binding transcriptional regulator [Myceligenerans indicum]MBL0888516.1 LacI family transcriptional regulator [Myceligenerans indicum]
MVSINDVARHAQVSVATVSNYLNRPAKVAPATARRIGASIEQLGFVPRLSARQLRWRRSGIVGICVVNASNPFFAQVVRAAERSLSLAGLSVVVGSSYESSEQQAHLLGLFEQMRFDAVLVAPSGDIDDLYGLRRRGTPVVLVDQVDPLGVLPGVGVDHVAGGRAVAEHLVEQGRRRLLLATGPSGVNQTMLREEGFRSEAERHAGVSVTVVRSPDLSLVDGDKVGHEILGLPEGDRPDAVFGANDMHAIGIQKALLTAGTRIPSEVALVGYDDIPFAEYAAVPLTSVRQPADEIGRGAAELLLGELGRTVEGGSVTERVPVLVERESSAARYPA